MDSALMVLVDSLSKALHTYKLRLKDSGHSYNRLSESMEELFHYLQNYSLKPFPNSLETIINACMTVTRLEVEEGTSFTLVNLSNLSLRSSLANKAYSLVASLCRPFHGNVEETLTAIVKRMLPAVRLENVPGINYSPNNLASIQDHAISFLLHMTRELREKADKSVAIFIQNFSSDIITDGVMTQKAAEIIINTLQNIEGEELYAQQVLWFMKLGFNDKTCNRLFACEVFAKILLEVKRQVAVPTESHGNDAEASSTQRFLYTMLLALAANDLSGSVRMAALNVVGNCAASSKLHQLTKQIFLLPYMAVCNISNSVLLENKVLSVKEMKCIVLHPTDNTAPPLPGAQSIFNLIHRLTDDDQVSVRIAAIQTLCNLMQLNRRCVTHLLVHKLALHCADNVMAVRLAAVDAIVTLLRRYPHHMVLQYMWVHHVLPRVLDNDETIVDRVMTSVVQIMNNISPPNAKHNANHESREHLPWNVLRVMMHTDKRIHLAHALANLTTENEIDPGLVMQHMGTENNTPMWFLLEIMARHMKIPDIEKVVTYCESLPCRESPVFVECLVVHTLRHQHKHLLPETKEQLHVCGSTRLNVSNMPFLVVQPWLNLMVTHCTDKWAMALAATCLEYVTNNIDTVCSGLVSDAEVNLFLQMLLTYAQVAAIKRDLYHRGMQKIVPKLWRNLSNNTNGQMRSSLVLIMTTLAPLDMKLATQELTLLQAALTQPTTSMACKVNICHGFKEMCIAYWSLSRTMLPLIFTQLRDASPDVRNAALCSVVDLLRDDYLKITDDVFFHVVSATCDQDKAIYNQVVNYLRGVLHGYPNLMSNKFIPCLLYFNNTQNRSEKRVRVTARLNERNRRQVFCFMLNFMNDREKFDLYQHICTQILNAVSSGQILLNTTGENLVKDTLFVLSSENLKLSVLRSRVTNTPPTCDHDKCRRCWNDEHPACADEKRPTTANDKHTACADGERPMSLHATATAKVVRNLIVEVVLPSTMRLKAKMEKLHSQLIPGIREFLGDVVSTYDLDVAEHFDKRLAAEILADIKAKKPLSYEKRASSSKDTDQIPSPDTPELPEEMMSMLANLTPDVCSRTVPSLVLGAQNLAEGVLPFHTDKTSDV